MESKRLEFRGGRDAREDDRGDTGEQAEITIRG